MTNQYRRPGRRPGHSKYRGRQAVLFCLLALLIGMIHLRTMLNRSIYESTVALEQHLMEVHELDGQVGGLQVEIDRLTSIARLGPRAEQLGLVPPTPDTVTLLPPTSALVAKGARPLPGAGALGRLVRHATAWTAARATAARDGGRGGGQSQSNAAATSPAGAITPMAKPAAAIHHARCSVCRDVDGQQLAAARH